MLTLDRLMLTHSAGRIPVLTLTLTGCLICLWSLGSVLPAAQPPQDVEQRGLRQLIRETEESLGQQNWLQAAEQFDSAWAMACEKDDPLMVVTGTDIRQLAPGETESQAGGKASLESLFRSSPAEFRKEFARQYSDLAENRIGEAIQSGNLNELRQASARYAFSPAARGGIRVLAALAMDRGEFLEAALFLGRLQRLNDQPDAAISVQMAFCFSRAGLSADAVDTIRQIQTQSGSTSVKLGDQSVELPDAQAVEAWISKYFGATQDASPDWLQPGGSYRRFAVQSRTAARFQSVWKSDTFSVNDVLYANQYNPVLAMLREAVELEASWLMQRNSSIVPTSLPLLAGELVVIRTPFGIRAVNQTTGELIWEVTRPDSRLKLVVEEFLEASGNNRGGRPRNTGIRYTPYIDPRRQLMAQLVRTNTASQMSISGRTLFAVDESSAATWDSDFNYGIGIRIGPDESLTIPSNFIRAYDVESGLFKWEVGGQTQNASQSAGRGNPLTGYYFLGAPLVLGQRTYALAESGEGIFLIQISEPSPADNNPNPTIVRSQILTVPYAKLPDHPVRMHAGLIPSFAQGLLICPTCDERIIAVSAEDHSIRWVFRYAGNMRTQDLGGTDLVISGGRDAIDTRRVDLDSRWIDSLPRIVDGKVLVTPRDADLLYCLDLVSGEELWKVPRAAFHGIGAVVGDRVILVGNQRVSALRISDGSTIWSTEIRGGIVCGTTATNGTLLQVPTTEPAIVSLDLENGKTLVRQTLGLEATPGNLLITKHGVLSQSLTSVRFAASVSEPSTVAERATELLLENQSARALELLEQETASAPPDADARELLIEVLLEALRTDFPKHRSYVPRVRELVELSADDTEPGPLLHSLIGLNLPDVAVLPRQFQGRFDRHLGELSELIAREMENSTDQPLEDLTENLRQLLRELPMAQTQFIGSGFLVRRKSAVLIAGMRKAILTRPAAEQSIIQDRLQATATDIVQSLPDDDSRVQFLWELTCCGMPALTLSTISATGEAAAPEQFRLVTELARLPLSQSSPDGPAFAKSLLESWKAAGDLSAVRAWLSDISTPVDPNTGLRFQMKDAASRDAHVAEWKQANPDPAASVTSTWSAAPVVTESDDRSMLPTNQLSEGDVPNKFIPVYGAPGVYRGWSFALTRSGEELQAYDPDGFVRWTLDPPVAALESRYGYGASSYATAYGHLLMLNLNDTLLAIDPTRIDTNGRARVLWQTDVERLAPDTEANLYRDFVPSPDRLPQYFPQPAGFFPVGPATSSGVPVISGVRLLVLNPLTGAPNWFVDGIARDTVLLCRGENVLLLSETLRQIEVRSLTDGTVTTVVRIPDWWRDANENLGSSVRDIELEPGIDFLWRVLLQGQSAVLFRLTSGKSAIESRDLLTDKVTWSIELPQDTVFSNVIDDVVAVLSDGQQLKLIQVDTGRILADLTVTKVIDPRELILRESHGHLIVLPEAVDDPSLEFDPVTSALHVYGRMYAIAKDTLNLAWDEPLDHRHFRLMMPEQSAMLPNAPVLVLLHRGGSTDPASPVRRTRYGVRVVDVRTGKDVYSNSDVGITLNYHWLKIDAASRKLLLSFERRLVTLDYSAKTDSNDAKKP